MWSKKWQAQFEQRKVLAAVSGGVDSMVLAHLLLVNSISFEVCHVNFQLRDESNEDEAFVNAWCKKNNIRFHSIRAPKEEMNVQGKSVQMAARDFRYRWFDVLKKKYTFDFVVTAHHVNDSWETAMLHFLRGKGWHGLTGISEERDYIVRPLLTHTKEEIKTYAEENKIDYREDASNARDDYDRNFIRHHLYPVAKKINPSVEQTFLHHVKKINAASIFLQEGLQAWKEKYWHEEKNIIRIDKKGLEIYPERLAFLLEGYGFHLHQVEAIITALHTQSGKEFKGDKGTLYLDRTHLLLTSEDDEVPNEILISKPGMYRWKNFSLTVSELTEIKNNKAQSPETLYIPAVPVLCRPWRAGDYFFYEKGKRKKVSDLLIDLKIPQPMKKNMFVLEQEGIIVWVIGLRKAFFDLSPSEAVWKVEMEAC